MLRIVFIGTGGIARQHANGLVKRDDVTLAGAFDIVASKAQEFCRQYGGQAYGSLGALLDAARPDAAWVCIPPNCHGETERTLLERGIPFLVEKPVSNSLETARGIAEAVARSGVLAVPGYMTRYRRSVQRAREILAQDPPILAHGAWIGGTPGVAWWRVKAESGGQIVEQTTHTYDLVRYLVGEPETVYAVATRGFVTDLPNYDVEDASSVAVTFGNGARGSVLSCCASKAGGGVHLAIACREHYLSFTGWEHTLVVRGPGGSEERIEGESNIFEIEGGAFIEAVRSGDRSGLPTQYADGLKTLQFCLAADRSLTTGQAVSVGSL
ncbi:MAG: Gfo/Idh/MocA family protein [Anaerolineae bacterium]